MKKPLLLSFLLLFSLSELYSQSTDSYSFYVKNASHNAVLYRGLIEKPIRFIYSGTYYAYSSAFSEGDVYYNGKIYHDVLINLNALTDELDTRYSNESQIIILEKKLVKYFVMDNRNFINIQGDNVPDGYYEVLYHGKSDLLKKNAKFLFEEEFMNRDKSFVSKNRYYILKDGVYYPVNGKKSFVKYFKDRKKEIGKVSREASTSLKDDKDAYYITLISKGCNQ